MLGKNRIRKIERLFNIKFEIYSDCYSKYNFGYTAYINTDVKIMIFFYVRCVCLFLDQQGHNIFKCKKFKQVLQIIHEYLYDSRDNNKG